ncbi:hypothetical protein PHET_07149 [Paragonimus heterotremus]|uniref:Uncharacterized protein n=1 Tax=Paragonimus heterotremus TaxID=100268 RepID=A0A8J4WVU6_9TREM|nr:hypothetical protein PHET_07149 [Paragonimus heterotremus]
MPSRQNSDQFVRTETGSVLQVIDGISTKQVAKRPMHKSSFQVTRAQVSESQSTTCEPIRRRSLSTPQELSELQVHTCPQQLDPTHTSNKAVPHIWGNCHPSYTQMFKSSFEGLVLFHLSSVILHNVNPDLSLVVRTLPSCTCRCWKLA